jgi:uncharacterized repeat protein (TIGR01451 family)
MRPNLAAEDDVIVAPVSPDELRRGDVAFVQTLHGPRVHRVTNISSGEITTRGDAGLESDPPTSEVLGRVVALSRKSRVHPLSTWRTTIAHPLASFLRWLYLAGSRRLPKFLVVTLALVFALILSSLFAPAAHAQTADLALTQANAPLIVAQGSNITYTETVTNNGPNAATTPVIYQQTPPNTTFVSITKPNANWTCATPAVGGTGQVTCTLTGGAGTLGNGGTANFTFVVQVAAATAAGTVIVNSANVTSQTTDSNGANNATLTSTLVEITGDADLGVTMQASPTPVFIDSTLSYQIVITNYGLASATAVMLADTLPGTLTFVSATPSQGTCNASLSLSCSLGTLAASATATVNVVVTSPASASTITNTATVSTSSTDPVASNNSATSITIVQPIVCATPGKDGAAPAFSTNPTIVNAYYPPAATGTLAAGATTVTLGAAAANGAQTAITTGDLLLVIQMQDAAINSTNSSSYGSGIPGVPSGWTALNNAGNFEFVTATTNVAVTGGALTFKGTGPTGGLLNTYTYAAYSAGVQGQRVFQVIRVPQYTSVTLSSNLSAMSWNGATGGVLAIDATSQVTLGGTVALDGLGFRGGGGRILGGGTGANTDYITLSTDNTNAPKGEGIAGTPAYVLNGPITALTQTALYTGSEGLPNGSQARGAPGNAGGGGTDGVPTSNADNSGGGGGANGGKGGYGGYGWNTATINGGSGGTSFPATTSSLILGGGGGAGTTNDGSYYIPANGNNGADCGANCTGIYSSGAAGGGIVILHAGSITGTGSITSNGGTALDPANDGAGGGGAGGSIRVLANSGPLTNLTVSAKGGTGGSPWVYTAPGGFTGNRHGPGGGGGGGVIFLSSAPLTSSVIGGNNGVTTTAADAYGSTPGAAGFVVTNASIPETPGTQPGAYCAAADLAVTNSASPSVVLPGGTITYTQMVTNNGPFDAVNGVFSEAIPANTTFQSIVTPTGWTCTTPAVGATGNISCTNPDFANAGSSTFTVAVQVNAGTTGGTQIVDVANIISGTSDPNLTNNSATATTTVGVTGNADLAVTNTSSAPTTVAGSNVTMTAKVTNLGPSTATSVVFTEAIPTNTTLGALFVPPAGWACNSIPVGGTGTLTCSISSLAFNATATFPLVLQVTAGTASGTQILATANITSATPDPNSSNNAANATTTVAAAGQSDLAVSSSALPNPVSPGNNITYTQSVTNNGPAASSAATFTDTIPTGTTLASFTPPPNWTCNSIPVGGTGTITCTLNIAQTIAVGASVNFPLVVQVKSTTAPGTTITNTANINIPCSGATDPNCGNNTASTNVIVASPTQADVSITKTGSPNPVNQGTNLTYTLAVSNGGPAVAQGVTVSDNIPSTVTYVSASTQQGSCSTTTISVTTPYVSTLQVNCNLGSISVGAQVLVTINVTATTFSSGALTTNTATVSSTTSDPNSSNNTSSAITTIQAATAVSISSFNAFHQPDGSVLLEWHTLEESRNLGFHIYREDTSGRHRIDTSLVAGSALLLRGSKPQHAAKTYRWVDSQPTPNGVYWIEDVDINGTRTLHGPALVQSVESAPPSTAATPTVSPALSQLRVTARPAFQPAPRPRTPRPILPVPPANLSRVNLADQPAIKIAVDQEGWYSVPFTQLYAAGLDPNIDPRTLHLYAEGVEQALLVSSVSSGVASPDIEFYGTGIDTPFSGTRIYWLVQGNNSPKRILAENPSTSSSPAPASFPFTVVREDRVTYFAALLNGEDNDNFFGPIITSEPAEQDLLVAHLDTSSSLPVTLDVALQGVTDAQPHATTVQFNGTTVGEMNFVGQVAAEQTFSIDASLVQEGTNTVTLTALDGDNDISLVNFVQLNYPHTYAADSDWLRATAPAGSSLQITGFSNSQIRVFDITDPLNIAEIPGKVSASNGSYQIALALPYAAKAQRTILAFAADSLSTPVSLEQHTPANLDQPNSGADVVIISHPGFVSNLAPLVQLREAQGHHVSLVTTEQIFDQYNFGEPSPFAMRTFLQNAVAHWTRKPQSVLFVGGASFDPRDYLGLGSFDFVPTRIIETAAFKTASDDWFTDFQQTGYATIPTGRLPVRTTADADLVVSKIVNYEQGSSAGSWNSQAVFIADQDVDTNFSNATTAASTSLPSSVNGATIYTDGLTYDSARSQILSALNAGSLLVNYNGHGAEQQWSFVNLFDTNDAQALTNGARLPVYLLMDCLNGFFHDVYAESLSTSLLLAPNGGAVAVWASSGFTNEPPQSTMNQALLQQFASHPQYSLGRLIFEAKSGTSDSDVRRTWILFGDPAMKLQVGSAVTPASASKQQPISQIPGNTRPACSFGTACPSEKAKQ